MTSPSPQMMILSQDNQEKPKSELPPKLPRGRKPSKSNKHSPLKKKPLRRGMGIERLERLRQHEKFPEAGGFSQYHQFQTPPLMPLAAASPYVVGSDLNRSSTSFMPHKVISTFGGGACGNECTPRDHNWVGGLVLETSSSKELSSIPKVMHQCDAYSFKNKCTMNNNMEEVVPSLFNCHLLSTGLNNHGLEMKPIYHKYSERMGITKLQASSSVVKEYEFFPPGKGLKEYEFFPGTNSARGYTRSASEQPNIHYYTEGAASSSSYFITSDYSHCNAASTATNNSIDLSLKL